MSIFITGSVAYDFIMDFPGYFKDHIMPEKIHVLNLSFLVDTMKRNRGGVAAHIAYTMALLGAPPPPFSSVGANDWEPYGAEIDKLGINAEYIEGVPKEIT